MLSVVRKIACLLILTPILLKPALAQDLPQVHEGAADLQPSCSPPQYSSPPSPDVIAELLQNRKRYRLVIGAGEYYDHPKDNNRAFVDPTAVLVDSRLSELGYEPLPGVSRSGKPYLVGKNVTRAAITAALREMASITQGHDFGIVYYVGHGNIAPSGTDLSLGIYDEPVASDQGYRVSDIFGVLQTSIYRTSVAEIPHIFVILDACFSGTVAQSSTVGVVSVGGVQHLTEISGGGPVIPDQVAILTATTAGASSAAYELQGTGLSAFGYYFARALKEDWACSDSLAKDGILTLQEMTRYLETRLQLASSKGAIQAPMSPTMLARDKDALLAYRADKYAEDGFRDLVYSLLIKPSSNNTADLVLPGGVETKCSDSKNGCRVPVSKAYATSDVTVAVSHPAIPKIGAQQAEQGESSDARRVYSTPPTSVKLADVINGSMALAGVTLTVTQSTRGCNSPAINGVSGDVHIDINAPCTQQVSPPANRPDAKGGLTSGKADPVAPVEMAPSVDNRNAQNKAPQILAGSTQQTTSGACSPAVSDTHGSVTIACGAVGPAPTDWFHIYLVDKTGSVYKVNQTEFTYSDIKTSSTYTQFRTLLTKIPDPVNIHRDVLLFRLRDEIMLTPNSSTTATSDGNLGILVIPREIIADFGDSHLAFTYFKSYIDTSLRHEVTSDAHSAPGE